MHEGYFGKMGGPPNTLPAPYAEIGRQIVLPG
jgi:hypothetical protein